MNQEKIGLFLKQLRSNKGLTQEQLAEHLHVSNRSVSRWETGSTMPDIGLLVELADFYEVELKELIDGERKSETMNEIDKETINRVVEYSDMKKKSELETFAILTEILIVIGMIISFALSRFVADSTPEMLVTFICGWFVWGFGLLLRIKVARELKVYKNKA